MDNVTIEKLKREHGDNAANVYNQISDLGGFGANSEAPHYGGLDIKGVLAPDNHAISASAKSKIAELAGVSNEHRDAIESGTAIGESSAHKMQPKANK